MKLSYLAGLLLACLLVDTAAAAERRDHEAHVHGVAEMEVAALGDELEIVLMSPAMNLAGFEHEPRTDDQRERLEEAIAVLRHGDALFSFGNVTCRLVEVEVNHGHDETAHAAAAHAHDGRDRNSEHGHDEHAGEADDAEAGHEHGHEDGGPAHGGDHDDATHSEIHAHYHFECEGSVERVETVLFERFPLTGSIRARYLTDEAQGAQTLTPDAATLRLE